MTGKIKLKKQYPSAIITVYSCSCGGDVEPSEIGYFCECGAIRLVYSDEQLADLKYMK
jgi:hypothetical protein